MGNEISFNRGGQDRDWGQRERREALEKNERTDRKWGCVCVCVCVSQPIDLPPARLRTSNASYFRTVHRSSLCHWLHHGSLQRAPSMVSAMMLMKMVVMMTMTAGCWCRRSVMWTCWCGWFVPRRCLFASLRCHWDIALRQTAASDSACEWKHWVSSVCECVCLCVCVCVRERELVQSYRPPARHCPQRGKLRQETSVQTYAQCCSLHTRRHGGMHTHTRNWLFLHLRLCAHTHTHRPNANLQR